MWPHSKYNKQITRLLGPRKKSCANLILSAYLFLRNTCPVSGCRASLCHMFLAPSQTLSDTALISAAPYYAPVSPGSQQETDGTLKLRKLRQV